MEENNKKKLQIQHVIVFVMLSVLHLFLALQFIPGEDWLIQWYTSIDIVNGIPMYEQTFKVIDGVWINIAYHFPVFFYAQAGIILIFGTNQVVGRIFLWVCTNLLFYMLYLLIKPKTSNEIFLLLHLYFLNPFLMGITALGLFDQFVFLFIIAAILLIRSNKHVLAGIVLGLGVMTKLYPGMIVIPYTLSWMNEKEYHKILKLGISSFTTTAVIFGYFFINWGQGFLKQTIYWQSNRYTISMSIWWNLDFAFESILRFGIPVIMLVVISIIYLKSDKPNLYLILSSLFIIFILALKSLYPQYGFWFSIFIIPYVIEKIHKKEYREPLLFIVVDWVVFGIGSVLWTIHFAFMDNNIDYRDTILSNIQTTDSFLIIGAVMTNVALILHLSICGYILINEN